MLLFGHPAIDFTPFYHVIEINEVELTPANSTLFIEYDEDNLAILKHLHQNKIDFALEVDTLVDVVLAHNFGARYIVVAGDLAQEAQAIAENYLFDAKILCRLQNEGDLEEKIRQGLDGVIYPQAIVKISS